MRSRRPAASVLDSARMGAQVLAVISSGSVAPRAFANSSANGVAHSVMQGSGTPNSRRGAPWPGRGPSECRRVSFWSHQQTQVFALPR